MITTPSEALRVLLEPGSVAELRIPNAGPKRTVSGYFNDFEKMGRAGSQWSGKASGVYFTLNPVMPELLSRANNRVIEFARTATSDHEIVRRRYLPLDFDVVRPAGISSSDAEHESAISKAREARAWLRAQGWPDPIFGDSGNGAHLDYLIDLPADTTLVERALKALAARFSDSLVKLDDAMHNAARIWKLYGTLVCKGDSTKERPHRMSGLIEVPTPFIPVPERLLVAIAAPEPKAQDRANGRPYEVHQFDLEAWLEQHQDKLPPLGIKREWKGVGWKREFEYCPWNREHANGSAFIGRQPNGAIVAACQHHSCAKNGWRELRSLVGEVRRAAKPAVWTEDDLALLFTATHPDLRYVSLWKKWMRYDGARWQHDSVLSVFDRSREICRGVITSDTDPKEAKWLRASCTRSNVENMARSDPRHAATPEQWDCDLWLLNSPGGAVELKSGETRAHRMDDHLTKSTAVAPVDGDAPLWFEFLERITGGDLDLKLYLQRAAGYCLNGVTDEHVLFFLYGTGANGKSTFVNTLLGICGDYAQVASMDTFTESKNDRHPTELASLRGARLVTASETGQGKRWDEGRIKMLTGGDPVRARFMHCDEFEFIPQFKLMLSGNHKPALRSVDVAMRRRVHLIPFTVTIPTEERDPKLKSKLTREWPQIMNWAVDGCLEWQSMGLNPPTAVCDATEQYFSSEDAMQTWMDERCIVSLQAGTTRTSVLYQDFKQWAERTGEFCGSQKRFSQQLMDKGFKIRESHGKVMDGITLRSEPEP